MRDVTDDEIRDATKAWGIRKASKMLGIDRRTVQRRMRRIEQDGQVSGKELDVGSADDAIRSARLIVACGTCNILLGSDAHYWPGKPSTSHKAFVHWAKVEQPQFVILNGDVIDAAGISRHPPIGWENRPNVRDELDVAQERTGEIENASPDSEHIWTLGNHDARFETRLATVAPEFRNVHGIHLKDHFPNWKPAWSVDVDGKLMVKHNWKGGAHAAYTNTVHSGRSTATGHLHRLGVRAFRDYNGTRFGIETGLLADPMGPQFTGYTQDNPLDWHEGFMWLTFRDGELMWPEPIHVVAPGRVSFRGKEYNV